MEGGKILQDTQILVVGKLLPPTLHFNLIFGWGTFLANICDGFLLVGLGWGDLTKISDSTSSFALLFFESDTFELLSTDGATTVRAVATNFFISGYL